MLESSLWEPEVLELQEFFTALLSMDDKYAVKLPTKDIIKFRRK